jgi:hypothetical protein
MVWFWHSIPSLNPSLCASTPSSFAPPSINPSLLDSSITNQSFVHLKPKKSFEKFGVFQDN